MNEEQELCQNGILPHTVSRWIYLEYKKLGLPRKEAIEKTVDAIASLRADGMSDQILNVLNSAFFNTPGNWV